MALGPTNWPTATTAKGACFGNPLVRVETVVEGKLPNKMALPQL